MVGLGPLQIRYLLQIDTPQKPKSSTSDSFLPTNKTRTHLARELLPGYMIRSQLQNFIHTWKSSMTNQWILSVIEHSYRIEFSSSPPHHFIPSPVPKTNENLHFLLEAIQHLLDMGSRTSSLEPMFSGSLLTSVLIPKRSEDWRAILSLRNLHHCVKKNPTGSGWNCFILFFS